MLLRSKDERGRKPDNTLEGTKTRSGFWVSLCASGSGVNGRSVDERTSLPHRWDSARAACAGKCLSLLGDPLPAALSEYATGSGCLLKNAQAPRSLCLGKLSGMAKWQGQGASGLSGYLRCDHHCTNLSIRALPWPSRTTDDLLASSFKPGFRSASLELGTAGPRVPPLAVIFRPVFVGRCAQSST